MSKGKGPQFIRFFKPIIEVLKESGGSGTVAEVIDRVIEKMRIPESEQQEILKGGQTRVRNQIQWARFYLANAGYIDSSKRGIWTLTEKGLSINAMTFDALGIFKEIHKSFQKTKKPKEPGKPPVEETEEEEIEPPDHRTNVLNLIKSLPPGGFERLSQRLLRESGFSKVEVTGRTGDGGIDGVGILQVNPFVSFNVLFQCKRYHGAVTPSQIRDFRGAMMGRADKGIIITTGTFTLEAKKEARRDGAPPIELVDGDTLVQMFEQLQLGLIPKTAYDVDEKFFDEFRK
ncbi:MAG: restriction endonuclease [Deltaproteobacteria bacterium]|nr:restriction endonuclease [Deltaproteobacteria bacterium]